MNRLPFHSKVSLVVPCFNEEQRLDVAAFLQLLNQSAHLSLVFVDDGSSDDTFSLLQELRAESPDRIYVERLSENRGKGEAVRVGMRRAMELGCELVGYWDADLATPLSEVSEFQRLLQKDRNLRVVLGCRLPLLGHQVDRHPLRAVLGRIFATAASLVLGFRIRDTQCGAKLFRHTRELAGVLEQPFSSKWIFDVELLARLTAIEPSGQACGFYELPLAAWSEKAGSKVRIRHFFRAATDLAGIFRAYSGQRRDAYRQQFELQCELRGEQEAFTIPATPIESHNSAGALPKRAA